MTTSGRHSLLAFAALAAFILPASASESLARKDGCTACHAVDAKLMGPGFKQIAAKYRDDAAARASLITKVRKGGAGAWGQLPMPATPPTVKDEDIQALVTWILTLK
jgi:cytochrome c